MRELLDKLIGYLSDYAAELVLAGVGASLGWWFGRRRTRARWAKREFLDRLNVSLNIIEDGKLLIRTLLEKSCEDVFLNTVAAEAVVRAARRTTAGDPLLPLPADDYWYYLNAVLNEVAEKFAEGQLRRDMGLPVRKTAYVLCLTCECAGPMKTRKVRAMVVQKKLLEQLPAEMPRFDSPHHITRWETLKQLAAAYRATPGRFLEVEICL